MIDHALVIVGKASCTHNWILSEEWKLRSYQVQQAVWQSEHRDQHSLAQREGSKHGDRHLPAWGEGSKGISGSGNPHLL